MNAPDLREEHRDESGDCTQREQRSFDWVHKKY